MAKFIFVVCQNGAESACKREVTRNHPELRLAFSRPGFITFKLNEGDLPEKFFLKSTLARTYGWSCGSATSPSSRELIERVLDLPEIAQANQLHLWQRDGALPGTGGFEPGMTPLAEEMAAQIRKHFPAGKQVPVNRLAQADAAVLDVVMVEPNQWWFGFHYATTPAQRWPGGVPLVDPRVDCASRAYLKLQEALLWSGIRVKPGDTCVEIGSAPGGACQLLLEKGARVIAVDPAEMDPVVVSHESLTHLKCRAREVRKRDLRDIRWLLADLNVAPAYTIDTVAEIATNQHVRHLRGMLLTLKLPDLELVQQVPDMIQKVKGLGFNLVRTRQLAFNRNEFCLMALRDQYALRDSRRKNG
ncbi:MAG: SAM-dependent methyltransferase [Mariniblastus sp.]|nr:SAM-dependent methyltransferase [Mariniblastus sp.]